MKVTPLAKVASEAAGAYTLTAVAYSPDGRVYLLDLASGAKPLALVGHKDAVRAVAFAPDGKTLASGSADKTLILWGVETGKAVRTLSGHDGSATSVLFTPDGGAVSSATDDRAIKVWAVADGKAVRTLDPERTTTRSPSPCGRTASSWCRPATATCRRR